MATVADQFAKWLDIVSSSNFRLETTLQKLTFQTTCTEKESNYHTTNTKTDVTETITEVVTKTSSIINSMSKPDTTMAQVFTVPASSITKMENDIATQPQTSILAVLAPPTNPVNKSPKVQHEMVISHPINLYDQTYHLPTLAKDKFTLGKVWFSPSPFIALCFCILKTFPPGLPCIPPKFVLLESKPEPP
ncbi:hypothetical protein Tco_1254338 [Tanacetum coccineum]